jgi:hypothetical protein
MPLVPTRFLFRYEIAIRRFNTPPPLDGAGGGFTDDYRLPRLHDLEGKSGFADLALGWHETGLYLSVHVGNKSQPPKCDAERFWKHDNVRLMTDMRDAREIRRATRYCQHFYFLPTGGGKKKDQPVAGTHRIQRASEHAALIDGARIPVVAVINDRFWSLDAHIPAPCLAGFNPGEHARIGFHTVVEDREHGQQALVVGDDLAWNFDPSTWATGMLSGK